VIRRLKCQAGRSVCAIDPPTNESTFNAALGPFLESGPECLRSVARPD